MSHGFFKIGLIAAFGASLMAGTAMAGGFSRGDANTDILFNDGTANIDAGFIYVNPNRKYDTISGANGTDGKFSDDFWIPNVAVAARPVDMFGCALTYTQSFGGSITYGKQAQNAQSTNAYSAVIAAGGSTTQATAAANASLSKGFTSNEYGATCDLRFDAGKGRLHVLGGLFIEDFSYEAKTLQGTLTFKDNGSLGFRTGLGYDIPEYALRASIMYRSEVKHNATGSFTYSPAVLAATPGLAAVAAATGSGTLPQSVKVALQTGVAPGWLVYGSVEWTNWSVLQALNYTVGATPKQDKYLWKDGWTIQAGVGHQFTDDIAGTLNVTWDQGVGTGADIQTDTWTFGAGARIKAGPGNINLGGGISYLTAGSQSVAKGATFNASSPGSWAYALAASYNIKF